MYLRDSTNKQTLTDLVSTRFQNRRKQEREILGIQSNRIGLELQSFPSSINDRRLRLSLSPFDPPLMQRSASAPFEHAAVER